MGASIIERVHGRRVWDSRGRPTVEVEITTASAARGRAIAPAGASTGSGEALDLRDGGTRLGGHDVSRAIANVNGPIAAALAGVDAGDQHAVDERLIALDATPGRRLLGGNAMIATSMAAAHAAAAARGEPLWRYLAAGEVHPLPTPEVQILGGGAHAGGRLDVQDFMIVPFGAASFAEAMEWVAEIYLAAGARLAALGRRFGVADEGGYWPAFESNEAAIETLAAVIEEAGFSAERQVGISLDIAASQIHVEDGYRLRREGRTLGTGEWLEVLLGWIRDYPILAVEDPFDEHDLEAHARLTAAVGDRVQVVGDDLLVTSAERIAAARETGACNTLLCKPNQAGTLSETRAALEAAREAGWAVIASARSGESEDVTIVHLALGWGIAQLKVGSFARSERMAKWNEAIRIEEALGERARYAGGAPFGR